MSEESAFKQYVDKIVSDQVNIAMQQFELSGKLAEAMSVDRRDMDTSDAITKKIASQLESCLTSDKVGLYLSSWISNL